jgi:hypothetical protein
LKYSEVSREKGGEEGERGDRERGEGKGDNMVKVRNHVSCFLKLHVLPHDVGTVVL